jgi:glycine/D-amino acid oxidase-like deaminating enzyme
MGRIAVIGAGVIGACVGYYLSRGGANVLLIDAAKPGMLTTNASFAWVNASSKIGNRTYFELAFAGLREYDRLVAALGDSGWWNPTGHVRCNYEDEQLLDHHVAQLRAWGYPAEVWSAKEVQMRLEPSLSFMSPDAPVALFPSEAWVDGPTMVQALVGAAVKHGAATAFGRTVRAVTVKDTSVTRIGFSNGEEYPVDAFVTAAGPPAPTVAALVGRILPMADSPGLAVRVKVTADFVGRVIHTSGLALRPDGPGRGFLLSRAVEPALKQGAHAGVLAESVRQKAGRVFPALVESIVLDARVGRRPIPADGLPAIGKAAHINGYYEAVTHSGITLGPIIGRLLTAEIMHGHIDPLVSAFRASRFRSG